MAINKLKPQFEKIQNSIGSSFSIRKFEKENPNGEPSWHFHPELELVCIADGNGKRHIGSHISYYDKGDLIMIGPNLPHFGFTDRFGKSQKEIVIQMREDFLGKDFFLIPEMNAIKKLFNRSKTGLTFYGNIKEEISERMNDLLHVTSFERITSFLNILQKLALTTEYNDLKAGDISVETSRKEDDRIKIIYRYIRNNFQEVIPLEVISQEVGMTVPAFCRYFKKTTRKTFTEFLNEFRVVHACKLLTEENKNVTEICYDCGFNNFSHFAKKFKKITSCTPTEYRENLDTVIY